MYKVLLERLIQDPLSSSEFLDTELWKKERESYLRTTIGHLEIIDIEEQDMTMFLSMTSSPIVPFYHKYKNVSSITSILRNIMFLCLLARFNYVLESTLRTKIMRYVYSLNSTQLMDLRTLLLADPIPTNLFLKLLRLEENDVLDSLLLLKEQFELWLRDNSCSDPFVFQSNRITLLEWYSQCSALNLFIVLTEWASLRSYNNLRKVVSSLNLTTRMKRLRDLCRNERTNSNEARMDVVLVGSTWFLSIVEDREGKNDGTTDNNDENNP